MLMCELGFRPQLEAVLLSPASRSNTPLKVLLKGGQRQVGGVPGILAAFQSDTQSHQRFLEEDSVRYQVLLMGVPLISNLVLNWCC